MTKNKDESPCGMNTVIQNRLPPITGTEMAYLYICPRKLWLFHHGIRPENEHVNVQIGRHIQETTFMRQENKKELALGNIGVVDWAELDKGLIHETKKSTCPAQAEVAQTRYYMWWMRHHGMDIHCCIIHYPKQRRTKELKWDEAMNALVEEDLQRARALVAQSTPPVFECKSICKNCAYQEYCMA
ncbi:MAG: CRISPR-associated protein Cas4 [Spartobacteria bacterium]|nr:CRISPR-associated protein Cas4 [Spartobacteria bacterium]